MSDALDDLPGTELVDWRQLPPRQRRSWWEHLWLDVVAFARRYRLALRSSWWEDPLQVEALAAFVCWLRLYDSGAYSDPPGKLQFLWELERLRAVIRAGERAFDAERDRSGFEQYLAETVTGNAPQPENAKGGFNARVRPLAQELDAVRERLDELKERQRLIARQAAESRERRGTLQTNEEVSQLSRAITFLTRRQSELASQLSEMTDG